MDRFTTLTVFARVVANGSFAGAARQLNMSPAAVSTHIQALEARLGTRLLNRTTRSLALTEVGQVTCTSPRRQPISPPAIPTSRSS